MDFFNYMDSQKNIGLRLKFFNLLLYGNFWIAFGAVSLYWQTLIIFGNGPKFDPLSGFLFGGTLCLYALHRLIGISKSHQYHQLNRYSVINQYRRHIEIYALLGVIFGGICFCFLKWETQLSLIIPSILSLGYVLPVLGNKKRLRDLNHIKIFLVAIVWAWTTVLLPVIEYDLKPITPFIWVFLERAFFIFAITLPFDIRDIHVDNEAEVKTIPNQIGIQNTKYLAIGLLFSCLGYVFLLLKNESYSLSTGIALGLLYGFTIWLIYSINPRKDDYFYTGWIDGTMILSGLLVYLFTL